MSEPLLSVSDSSTEGAEHGRAGDRGRQHVGVLPRPPRHLVAGRIARSLQPTPRLGPARPGAARRLVHRSERDGARRHRPQRRREVDAAAHDRGHPRARQRSGHRSWPHLRAALRWHRLQRVDDRAGEHHSSADWRSGSPRTGSPNSPKRSASSRNSASTSTSRCGPTRRECGRASASPSPPTSIPKSC